MKNKLRFILTIFALLTFSTMISAQDASKASTVCTQPPNTTMVAWYPFDDNLPITANLAAGNSGTLINGPVYVPGKVANALKFDGINDYVESPSTIVTNFGPASNASTGSGLYSTSQGNFTIDAWIKTASTGLTVIVDKRSPSPIIGYSFWLLGNKIGLQLADSSGWANFMSPPVPNLNNNQWRHVAVTVRRMSPTGITWYFDGLPIGNSNPTGKQGSLVNKSPLRIGTRTAATPLTKFFNGAIDELEIFNRALEPIEIRNIYIAGPAGKCKP